jgi:hypothetical protein
MDKLYSRFLESNDGVCLFLRPVLAHRQNTTLRGSVPKESHMMSIFELTLKDGNPPNRDKCIADRILDALFQADDALLPSVVDCITGKTQNGKITSAILRDYWDADTEQRRASSVAVENVRKHAKISVVVRGKRRSNGKKGTSTLNAARTLNSLKASTTTRKPTNSVTKLAVSRSRTVNASSKEPVKYGKKLAVSTIDPSSNEESDHEDQSSQDDTSDEELAGQDDDDSSKEERDKEEQSSSVDSSDPSSNEESDHEDQSSQDDTSDEELAGQDDNDDSSKEERDKEEQSSSVDSSDPSSNEESDHEDHSSQDDTSDEDLSAGQDDNDSSKEKRDKEEQSSSVDAEQVLAAQANLADKEEVTDPPPSKRRCASTERVAAAAFCHERPSDEKLASHDSSEQVLAAQANLADKEEVTDPPPSKRRCASTERVAAAAFCHERPSDEKLASHDSSEQVLAAQANLADKEVDAVQCDTSEETLESQVVNSSDEELAMHDNTSEKKRDYEELPAQNNLSDELNDTSVDEDRAKLERLQRKCHSFVEENSHDPQSVEGKEKSVTPSKCIASGSDEASEASEPESQLHELVLNAGSDNDMSALFLIMRRLFPESKDMTNPLNLFAKNSAFFDELTKTIERNEKVHMFSDAQSTIFMRRCAAFYYGLHSNMGLASQDDLRKILDNGITFFSNAVGNEKDKHDCLLFLDCCSQVCYRNMCLLINKKQANPFHFGDFVFFLMSSGVSSFSLNDSMTSIMIKGCEFVFTENQMTSIRHNVDVGQVARVKPFSFSRTAIVSCIRCLPERIHFWDGGPTGDCGMDCVERATHVAVTTQREFFKKKVTLEYLNALKIAAKAEAAEDGDLPTARRKRVIGGNTKKGQAASKVLEEEPEVPEVATLSYGLVLSDEASLQTAAGMLGRTAGMRNVLWADHFFFDKIANHLDLNIFYIEPASPDSEIFKCAGKCKDSRHSRTIILLYEKYVNLFAFFFFFSNFSPFQSALQAFNIL